MRHPHLSRREPAEALQPEPDTEDEAQARIPILATMVQSVIVPVAEDEDVLALLLATNLTTTLVHITRGQVLELGAGLLSAGRKMKRRPEKKKIEVVTKSGLVLPE